MNLRVHLCISSLNIKFAKTINLQRANILRMWIGANIEGMINWFFEGITYTWLIKLVGKIIGSAGLFICLFSMMMWHKANQVISKDFDRSRANAKKIYNAERPLIDRFVMFGEPYWPSIATAGGTFCVLGALMELIGSVMAGFRWIP